jgi:hypothetical protein
MTRATKVSSLLLFACAALLVSASACRGCREDVAIGNTPDEAMRAGRTPDSLPNADEDYFHAMNRGAALSPDEIKGRNNWIVWTGGNDRFWDYMAHSSYGVFDLLKTISSHPKVGYGRDSRWHYLGLVNEPCFETATGPDPKRFGLWLDTRIEGPGCPPDPFANADKYKGVAIGARGRTMPVGSYYGEPTGVVGLRLFPNPDFDDNAKSRWDAARFYADPTYYDDRTLVRPYRVGMSCGFCHVGPSPIHPPADPERPTWANLSSNPGAQYFWINRIFIWQKEGSGIERNFAWQLFHTSPPGALDTSFISTDYINNPRTMNAVYSWLPRLKQARTVGQETLAGGGRDNRQFQDFPRTAALSDFFKAPDIVWTPRVLKDGSDSVGALGALNRVFLNIGLFSEEWLLHFRPMIGGKPISPIKIADAKKNSVYWNATEQQTPDVALFFLKTAQPDRLAEAADEATRKSWATEALAMTHSPSHDQMLTRGKAVFAERCARCHSSKQPAPPPGIEDGACAGGGNGSGYLACWDKYWRWTKTDAYKQAITAIVAAPDFLDDNYLSTERRVPVTLLQTNACSPLATNALEGNIWDNFSSRSYKDLPSVGTITVHHPVTGEPRDYVMPAGGRGYTRPASLISVWSTAPYLLNNSVGKFNYDPSVTSRLDAFRDGIVQLLWPEKRKKDLDVINELGLPPSMALNVPGYLYRTTAPSYVSVTATYLPDHLKPLLGFGSRWLPWAFSEEGSVQLGPIPKGTPVNLLANLQVIAETPDLRERVQHGERLLSVLKVLVRDLKEIQRTSATQEEREARAREVFLKGPAIRDLLALSKCPDYVVNRGHYFGTSMFAEEPGLGDEDKWALIEFLKTL